MPQGLVILGSYILAEEVFDLISDMPGYEVAAFIENFDRERCGKELEGRPIVWIDDAAKYVQNHRAVCALSTTKRKSYCEQAAAAGFKFATLVHPTARVSSRATLGEGTFISAMSTVATRTTLGRCVFVNRGALIGHHTNIGDYCTIQPGANVAGLITMGEQSYVGMGAVVLERKKIGAGCVIAAGAVVVSDVPDHVQVMGVPAKVHKADIEVK
jgi:sugar O-acyltransferase (sialic acid O-acetyltransferase NeuD family)